MKRIGIIGGIGPESTVAYYRLLIERFREKLSTKHYPEILLHSIDMTEMLDFVFNNKLEELVEFLRKKIQVLEEAKVDFVALASNTPHLVFDQLANSVNVEMISIVEETCKAVSKTGIKSVGLLGTKSTMSEGFYQRVGTRYGIEMMIPNEENQNYIHEKYMSELVFNQINYDTKKRLIEIANDLAVKAESGGIILGGTELPLILKKEDFDTLEVFDTTQIHVDAILIKMIE